MISKVLIAITLCVFVQLSVQVSIDDPTLPQIVIETMGSRDMRYHHFLWHNLRENWLNLDAATQHAIAKVGWAPPRPAAFYRSNGEQVVLEDNDSGEEFLYMHRQMIAQVNKLVAGTAYGKVTGWSKCPSPGDPKWPVPDAYEIPGDAGFTALIATMKSNDFYWNTIVPMEEELEDEDNLRSWTLGQYGAKIEFSVHKWMHLRFSELTALGARAADLNNPTPDIDSKWEDLSYRWLGDTFSSHVNPVFWRIHGWVDNKIELWRQANNLETITWKGTWEQGPWSVLEDLFVAGAVKDSDDDDSGSGSGSGDGEITPEIVEAMRTVANLLMEQGLDNYFSSTSTTAP